MMRIAKLFPVLFLILLESFHATAQHTPAELGVKHELEGNTAVVLQNVAHSVADSNRVNLLIKLAHIYWRYRNVENNGYDSCFIYAKQANELSRKLGFTAGSNEAAFLFCKVYIKKNDVRSALELTRNSYGEQRVRLLLSIAEHYVFDFESNQKEFNEALPLIDEATRTASKANSARWLDECFILLGKYRFKQGNVAKGKSAFMEIINAAHFSKNYSREANAWSALGNRMPDDNNNYRDIIHCQEQAVKYYLLAGQKEDAAYSLRDLAVFNSNYKATDSAEHQILRSVAVLQALHKKISITTYNVLAEIYRLNGNYDKALYYAYEALKVPWDDQVRKIETYSVLAKVYRQLKSYPNALKYYEMLFKFTKDRNSPFQYTHANDIAKVEAESGNPRKALSFLSGFVKDSPLPLANYKQITACTFADIYNQMGNYKKAEQFYLEMLSYNPTVKAENLKNLDRVDLTLAGSIGYYKIGKFYIQRKNFKKGKNFLRNSFADRQYVDAEQITDTELLLFKADSALGDYISSIRHFQKYKTMSDSVNSVAKNKQITELNLKYETEQRLKDIKSLQNNELKQQAKLQHADLVRNIILASAVLLFLLALLAYNGYRNKQKTNKKLTVQREEIKSQYNTLQDLLAEKDNFLREKDWLLKEVHHRVKNNLQIVMSLLSTQSAHLQSNDAIEAILDSENRVQSIALIHQKLYSSDNPASIGMLGYVSDLTLQLSQAYDTKMQKIRFRQFIEDIYIDLSQAVPLGLILNEAITNAIKYAFDAEGGEIIISFKRANTDTVILSVADNGKGLPMDFDIRSAKSLGMEMMQGLSGQLRGTFQISNHSGTAVQIEFKLMPPLLKHLNINESGFQ
jgi:two-component sensor histidine kinase